MKRRLKSVLFFCLYYSGLELLLARLIRVRGVAVMMYHGVCERSAIPEPINFHLTPRVFEAQMRALKRRYRVLPLGEVVADLKQGSELSKGVVLTFDDGYRNNIQYVAPIMGRLGLTFSVFIATDFIEKGKWIPLNWVYAMWFDGQLTIERVNDLRKRLRGRPSAEAEVIVSEVQGVKSKPSTVSEESFAMLSWQEIRDLAANGTEIGSHTEHHCNMAVETRESQLQELRGSKQKLEEHLGKPVRLFAYPYGHTEHMSESSRQSVIESGYDCALSTERGIVTERSDRFRMPRLGYESPLWMFTGEILYEFARQAVRDFRSGSRVPRAELAKHSGAGTNLG